ncbi:MAG TPA: choice-of-anchor D domain-containing protein [Kofleriaceae bacterium]|nr:choice-of-anchor D domain-containing protein [Kofleriaceae bacterium]
MFNAPADAAYTVESLPPSLAANSTDVVTVRFSPTDTTSGTQAGETHTLRIIGTAGATAVRTRDMTLAGDGLSVGYVFDPTPLAIGNVRWDLTADGSVAIKNPYEATVRLTSASFVVNTGTATGELTRTDATAFPVDLLPGGMVTLSFRANPSNRLGAMSGTLTINSNLGTSQTPTRTSQVTANSVSPAVTINTPTHDFGPVDVDRGAVTKDLTLTNSGGADLNITSATISAGGSVYSVTATLGVIPPGMTFTATVSYDPTAVTSTNGTLTVGVAGVCTAPTACNGAAMPANFSLTGRGIDRVFTVTEPGLFPETYRNPGSQAPVKDVVVRNTGEAPLTVSALMITGEPVWSLVDAEPQVIPGGGTAAFKVRFAPTSGGKAPTGSLIITHDDNQSSNMAVVTLNGFGRNPMLSILPAEVISLGTTAVGFPVRLSDTYPAQLSVQNNDTKAFLVRELKLTDPTGDNAFSLTAELTGVTLAPNESRKFDIVFAAASVGEFDAQLQIFLDEDTEPASVVQIMGTVVDVQVQGGGGCQASSGGAGWLSLLVAMVLLGGARRSRKRALAAAALLLCGPLLAQRATAQVSRDLDLSLFRPAPATTGELLQVESPTVGQSGDWEVGLGISHLVNPLQVDIDMSETSNLVSQRTVFDLGLAVALAGRVELGARVATMSQSGDESTVQGLKSGESNALGDAMIHAKLRLLGDGQGFGLALASTVTLPTATEDAYAGPGKLTASGQLLLGTAARRWSAAANLGFGYQDKVALGNITQGNRALFGAGASLRATDSLWLSAELFGALAVGQDVAKAASPVEALLGLRYRMARTVGISLGLGTGVVRGVGAPAMHGVLAFELAPQARELAPLRPPAPYVAPPDGDGDKIPDAEDHCADQAEDNDGFADRDGCPDPDNDFDGISDEADKCPMQREDKDGVEDADGCPDLDDDKDGVSGAADKCPKSAEDKDGFEDSDGCPDLDDDKDGIDDSEDKCPREPETINDADNQDGCPDAGFSGLLVGPDRIELMTPVTFVGQTAKFTPASLTILDQVAATLRAAPEIARVRIGVHVHPRGKQDQELTERRAAAIREWLVQWGLAPNRLDVRGFGSEKPLVNARRRNAAAINDRIEFTIMERR